MGLRHLHPHDDRLHRHQRPLWSHARSHDRRLAGKDRLLILPHVLRLRRLLHSPLRLGSPLQVLLHLDGHVAPEQLAVCHDSDSSLLLCPLPPVLQLHPRAAHHRQLGLTRQRPQGAADQQTLVASQRSLALLQPLQHRARCHCGILLRRHHRRRTAHSHLLTLASLLLRPLPRSRRGCQHGRSGSRSARHQQIRQETHLHSGRRPAHHLQRDLLHPLA